VKVLGISWFRDLVSHCCGLAEYAQALLERADVFEILSPRQLSIIAFRYAPACIAATELDALNVALLDEVRATGRAFLSATRLQGQLALRLCFVNWRTSAADVEEVVCLIAEIGERLHPNNETSGRRKPPEAT